MIQSFLNISHFFRQKIELHCMSLTTTRAHGQFAPTIDDSGIFDLSCRRGYYSLCRPKKDEQRLDPRRTPNALLTFRPKGALPFSYITIEVDKRIRQQGLGQSIADVRYASDAAIANLLQALGFTIYERIDALKQLRAVYPR